MKLRNRALLRTGAAAAGLVVACAAFASPAFADTTADLEIRVDGGTIAEGADGKFAAVSVLNHGPSAATLVTVTYDFSGLDKTKVSIDESYFEMCDVAGDTITCGVTEDGTVASGADLDFGVPIVKVAGASGAAGSMKATVTQEGQDPKPDNNSVTAPVVLNGAGVDLSIWAPDVYLWDDEEGWFTDEPIPAGGSSFLYVDVWNSGDMAAKGFKFDVELPEHVSFANEGDAECMVEGGAATCLLPDEVIEPDDGGFFLIPVTVSADVEGPVALTDGSVKAFAIETQEPAPTTKAADAAAPAELPEWYDVDESDNVDEYSVFVAGGGEGGGGPLPTTGPAATAMAVGGGAIVLLGAVLLVVSRRRRVITQA